MPRYTEPMKSRLHVMLVTDWYFPIGGVEAFIAELAPHLSRHCDVTVAIHAFGDGEVPLERSNSLRVVRFGSDAGLQALTAQLRPDVVHFQQWTLRTARCARWLRRQNIPSVLTLHQVPLNTRPGPRRFLIPLFWLYLRYVTRLVAATVSPSPYIERLARRHSLCNLTRVISCGVDTGRYHSGNTQQARSILELPAQAKLVLYVGRYGHEKNVTALLEAAAQLNPQVDMRVVLVGFAATLSLKQQAVLDAAKTTLTAQGRLIELGPILRNESKHPLIYQAADVFVMPSQFETQSIATLEAMASGLPIIASQSGALPNLVQDGQNGRLINTAHVTALTGALERALRDTKHLKPWGDASRQRALAHDAAQTTTQYIALYRSLV
jgi:glycosyltransferase involved in cell wall biosynthesis